MIAQVQQWMERLFDLAVSRSPPGTQRERRSRSVVRGTAAALVARAMGSLTGFITVPLTVRYLGAERYGAWMTISSLLVFLGFSDFGLASSLTNALGKAFGENDRESARRYVTTTLLALCIVAVLLVLAGITSAASIASFMFPTVDKALLDREIIPALIAAMLIFALNFPLLVTNRVLAAYQENATANLWIMASSVATLIGILLVIVFRGGLTSLVLGSAGAGLIVNAVSSVWLYFWHKPWLAPGKSAADFQFARELFSTSWKFFIINAGWLVNSQTDNIIISHYLGPAQVTPYTVTFRLFAYSTLIQSLGFTSLWPAFTEAAARRDLGWIRGMFRKNLLWSSVFAFLIVTVLTIFGQLIIRIWAGSTAVPSLSLVVWMAAWNLLLAAFFAPSCLLQATGHITGLATYVTVTAVLNVALSILFVHRFGTVGVIAGTVIATALANYVPMILEVRKLLRTFERKWKTAQPHF